MKWLRKLFEKRPCPHEECHIDRVLESTDHLYYWRRCIRCGHTKILRARVVNDQGDRMVI